MHPPCHAWVCSQVLQWALDKFDKASVECILSNLPAEMVNYQFATHDALQK